MTRRKYYFIRYVKVPAIKLKRWFMLRWQRSWRFRISTVVGLFIAALLLQIFPQSAILPPAKATAASFQFTPVAGQIVTGTSVNVNGVAAPNAEGVNVGSWKGTLADDNYHWQVASTSSGYDANLTLGGVALNGANALFVQTEFDLDPTVPNTVVQICDWSSSSDVDNGTDAACTGGGWRTLNNRKQAITSTSQTNYTWQIYDGYWSDGSNDAVSTPLSNFVSSSNQAKVRYYSTTNTTSTVSIDYLKIQAVINPVYAAGDFTDQGGGTVTGDYTNTNAIHQGASDNQYLQFAGTGGSAPEADLSFKNIKTYNGMNTFAVRMETSCTSASAGLMYTLQAYNANSSTWEDMSSPIDCITTDVTNIVSKSNVTIGNYISNGTLNLRLAGDTNTTTAIRVDMMYLQMGSTNSDTNACEVSFGTNANGRVVSNPTTTLDNLKAVDIDSNYIYSAGYDTVGGDRAWRIEKRNKSDGMLVTAFGDNGVVRTDPSSGSDEINAIQVDGSYIYVAGFDTSPGNTQYRVEKRDITTGSLDTGFASSGVYTSNPGSGADQVTDIDIDATYIYLVGTRSTNVARYEKIAINDGSLDTGFDGDGILESAPASSQLTPSQVRVDGSSIYMIGTQANSLGQVSSRQGRFEKRDISNGAYDGTFGGGTGAVNSNLAASGDDTGVAIDIDGSYIYGAVFTTSGNPQWNIEKRDISSGNLETGFDTDGQVQVNPSSGFGELPYDIKIDSGHIYATGMALAPNNSFYMAKLDISSGALDTSFGGTGLINSRYQNDNLSQALAVDSNKLYVGGYASNGSDAQWMLEAYNISDGIPTVGFGGTGCGGARNIDTTGTSDFWRMVTENESSNQGHDYYPYDTDADTGAEEAAAGNTTFSVTLTDAMQPTGIFYAGRIGGGTQPTVQMGLRDYGAGLNTTGGWYSVGTATASIAYADSLTNSTPLGQQVNAADFINTSTNSMNMRVRTANDEPATNNSEHEIDFLMMSVQWVENERMPSRLSRFVPTASNLVTGTAQNVTSVAAANPEGVNVGSWRGLQAQDDFGWTFASTASGMDAQVDFGGVALNGANSMLVQTRFDQDTTVPSAVVQVCDWVSSTSVDNAADAQCTGGGWRTLNNRGAGTTWNGAASYMWQIYNGYWNGGTNTPVDTPLTNFLNSSTMRIRYYSAVNTTTTFAIDSAVVMPVVNSLYSPAGLTNLGSGSVTNTYSDVNSYVGAAVGSGSSAQYPSDDNRVGVAGTAGSVSDSYFSFKNIRTMPGMNTIMVRAEHRCSTTGIDYRPKIYNYQSGAWEDLTTNNIACSTTDATNVFAKNNVNLSDYLNNGEARIGWYGLANGTQSIETDLIYVMVGMTNADSSECEISFGTLSAGSCADTRDIDTTGSAASWDTLAEDESTNQGHDYYPYDTDADGVTEEAKANHLKFLVPELTDGPMIGMNWATRFTAGIGGTLGLDVRDYGNNVFSTTGGFYSLGASATSVQAYSDPFTASSWPFLVTSFDSYRDTLDGRMGLRMRSISDSSTATNSVSQWDFAFIAPIWIETTAHTPSSSEQLRHGGHFRDGVEQPIQL